MSRVKQDASKPADNGLNSIDCPFPTKKNAEHSSITAMWDHFINSATIQYGLSSLILLFLFITLRATLVQVVLKNNTLSGEGRRRWIVAIRNGLVGTFVVGLVFIWESQLSTFAVSLVAVALALVLATKELIVCMSGALLRMVTNTYGLGDRIEIDGIRGNVVDFNLLTTTLLEIGPGQTSHQYTGRAMVLPNSLMFTKPITNETYSKKYVVHVITIQLTTQENWERAETLLLTIVHEVCRPYIHEAQQHMKRLEGKNWLDAPSVKPRVTIQLPEPGKITLYLRVPSPAHRTSRTEQTILRQFVSSFYGSATQQLGPAYPISTPHPEPSLPLPAG